MFRKFSFSRLTQSNVIHTKPAKAEISKQAEKANLHLHLKCKL